MSRYSRHDVPAIFERREIWPGGSTVLAFFLCLLSAPSAFAQQDEEALRELVRKAQDPLADIKALMSDNMIDSNWGICDTFVQFYLSPETDFPLKWGIGPQVSVETRSSDWQVGASGFQPKFVIPYLWN